MRNNYFMYFPTLEYSYFFQVKIRDNAMVLMMGTKDEDMPSMPVEQTKFMEDMDEHELNKALEMPAGIDLATKLIYSCF